MNEHIKMEGKSAVKNKKELKTLDTQRFLALIQLLPLNRSRRLTRNIIHHAVHMLHFIHDTS
ncbi:hypothetical protein C6Y00_17860 [Bacillus sp. GBSC66]|nr:hypothetical protein C6Y00_17860 [Bacillus sp. GBSC66]